MQIRNFKLFLLQQQLLKENKKTLLSFWINQPEIPKIKLRYGIANGMLTLHQIGIFFSKEALNWKLNIKKTHLIFLKSQLNLTY